MPSSSPGFYPPEFTERSRSVLQRVHEAVPEAVLIGGWGAWVRTGGPMSHDIDLIVTRPQLATLKGLADVMSESGHLAGRAWRGTLDGVHLDLYVPYQSRLGQHLELRTERLVRRCETLHGWVVLELSAHLATKLAALLDRPESAPGDKDRHEIMALYPQGVDAADAVAVLHDASAREPAEVTQLIDRAFDYLRDLRLDPKQRRTLNQLATAWHDHSLRQAHTASPPGLNPPAQQRRERRLPGLDR